MGANVVARALTVLAGRGELPRPQHEVSFLVAMSDVEWQDLDVPVLTFQRGKKTRRIVRIPMWEQLDGSWTRKIEQQVLSHESSSLFSAKRGSRAFWRGTDLDFDVKPWIVVSGFRRQCLSLRWAPPLLEKGPCTCSTA